MSENDGCSCTADMCPFVLSPEEANTHPQPRNRHPRSHHPPKPARSPTNSRYILQLETHHLCSMRPIITRHNPTQRLVAWHMELDGPHELLDGLKKLCAPGGELALDSLGLWIYEVRAVEP